MRKAVEDVHPMTMLDMMAGKAQRISFEPYPNGWMCTVSYDNTSLVGYGLTVGLAVMDVFPKVFPDLSK